jgi:hypothetical protein
MWSAITSVVSTVAKAAGVASTVKSMMGSKSSANGLFGNAISPAEARLKLHNLDQEIRDTKEFESRTGRKRFT